MRGFRSSLTFGGRHVLRNFEAWGLTEGALGLGLGVRLLQFS